MKKNFLTLFIFLVTYLFLSRVAFLTEPIKQNPHNVPIQDSSVVK
jgi:hypothetical protein